MLDYAENFWLASFAKQKQPRSSCPRSRESARRIILNKINYIGIWTFPVTGIFICIWYVMKLSDQLCDVVEASNVINVPKCNKGPKCNKFWS